jgi:transcription initiation factor IIE alpha subunit
VEATHSGQNTGLCDVMESKLIKKLMDAGVSPSKLEFFTNRPELVVAKQRDKPAEVEYVCPYCKFYEIKTVQMEKGTTKSGRTSKKFTRPKFNCSKCGKTIEVFDLKKA